MTPEWTGPAGRPGPTQDLVEFAAGLDWAALPATTRNAALRHLVDTFGAMIGGARTELTDRVEAVLASVGRESAIPVPGRTRRADLLDTAFLAGLSAHGIELDDGYREGALHPGSVVVSALLPVATERNLSGASFLAAMVAGYEAMLAIGRACHPRLRNRGYHPTAAIGPLGAAVAAGRLLGQRPEVIANAVAIAASSAAGLHAYVSGGVDVKRLHAGHAAREGLQAALFADAGVIGPPNVLEGKDGFFPVLGDGTDARDLRMPHQSGFLIESCYIKPYPCCRHLHPAAEALIDLVSAHDIDFEEIRQVRVETYGLAAEFADLGWDDFASAQLSFRFVLSAAAKHRTLDLRHFGEEGRSDPDLARLAERMTILATPEMDARYPAVRPARVTVSTPAGRFVRAVDEASGAPELPLSNAALGDKFERLVAPAMGPRRAAIALERLWTIDQAAGVAEIFRTLAPD